MTLPERHCEAVIAGGGMVGMTLAAALAKAGLSVVLVDKDAPAGHREAAFDGRASAIAQGSQRVLEGLGLWAEIAPSAAAIREIRVSDGRKAPLGQAGGAAPFFLHYDAAEVGDQPLGYIVENLVTRRACHRALEGLPGLEFLAPKRIADWQPGPGLARVCLDDGQVLRAPLVVAAEGRGSMLRQAAGIATRAWDYPQVGIVATVGHEKPHGGVAHEHFLPAGPFALLPMVDGPLSEGGATVHRSSLVWTERRDAAPAVMALDDAAFAAEMMRRFGDSLGRLWVEGRRWCYPLSLLHAERYCDRRLALIGDAAHGIHPIAGQGLNLGLKDVAALAEAVVDARRLGLDIGAADVLSRYQRWRRFDNTAMVAATDGLNRLFSNDLPPVRLARDLGLAAVNRLPPVKRVLMRHAMGLLGDLPRLVRGQAL